MSAICFTPRQNRVFSNRESAMIEQIRDLRQKLHESNQQNQNLLNRLEYLKSYIPKEIKIKDLALNEIFRKEDVIQHKDAKATRLINIIREKNDIINNLKRRRGLEYKPSGACELPKKLRSAENDTNWRSKN